MNKKIKQLIKIGFRLSRKGLIGYKVFGYFHNPPNTWNIEKGSILLENVDVDEQHECSYGINIGTLKWIRALRSQKEVWKILVKYEDFETLIIPTYSRGKIRCGKATILKSKGFPKIIHMHNTMRDYIGALQCAKNCKKVCKHYKKGAFCKQGNNYSRMNQKWCMKFGR